jgi:hypothetical protein
MPQVINFVDKDSLAKNKKFSSVRSWLFMILSPLLVMLFAFAADQIYTSIVLAKRAPATCTMKTVQIGASTTTDQSFCTYNSHDEIMSRGMFDYGPIINYAIITAFILALGEPAWIAGFILSIRRAKQRSTR